MADYRRRQPATMSREERDRLIIEMHKKRYSWAQIGRKVNLSPSGARSAWERLTSRGRYGQPNPEEVVHLRVAEEPW